MATNILKLVDDLDSLTQNYKGNIREDAMKCGYVHKADNAYEVVNALPFLCELMFINKKELASLTLSSEELEEKKEILRKVGFLKVWDSRDLVHVNEELIDKVHWCMENNYPYLEVRKFNQDDKDNVYPELEISVLLSQVVDDALYKDNYYMNPYLFDRDPSKIPSEISDVDIKAYISTCSTLQKTSLKYFYKPLKIKPSTFREIYASYDLSDLENDQELLSSVFMVLAKDNSFVNPELIRNAVLTDSIDNSFSMRNGQR